VEPKENGHVRRALVPWTVLLAALVGALVLLRDPGPRTRHLVQFGWDEPDTAFLRTHVARMRESPFDGCVFHASWAGRDGRPAGNLAWRVWSRERINPALLHPAIQDLRATPFGTFDQNFLRLNVTPGDVDWFEDPAPLLANLRLASQVARAGHGVRGFVLDTEAYEAPLFSYRRQTGARARPFEAYAAQARVRGREAMRALRSSYPDATVILTFGHTVAWWESGEGRRPLEDLHYGLLPAFVDGLVDGSPAGSVVDGFELAYAYRSPAQFAAGRRRIRQDTLPFVADPGRYARVVRVGFGLWLDYDWRRLGWDADHPERNYFTPAGFDASVRAALAASDGYVWIYNETPRFWTEPRVPAPYLEALRRARSGG
jgi:hypothetical protein